MRGGVVYVVCICSSKSLVVVIVVSLSSSECSAMGLHDPHEYVYVRRRRVTFRPCLSLRHSTTVSRNIFLKDAAVACCVHFLFPLPRSCCSPNGILVHQDIVKNAQKEDMVNVRTLEKPPYIVDCTELNGVDETTQL